MPFTCLCLPWKPANYVQVLCKRWKGKDNQANYKGEIFKRTKHLLLPSKQLKKRGFANALKANWVLRILPTTGRSYCKNHSIVQPGWGGGKQQHSLKHCNTWDIWAVFHYCSFLTWAHISGMSGLLSTSAAREDVCSALNEPSSQHCWEKTRLPTSEVVKFNLLHISCCWNCPRSSSLTWVDIASLSDNTN